MKIRFKKLDEGAQMPTQANEGDAGYDIRAICDTIIRAKSTTKIRTGIAVEIPTGYELQVRGKSGMAYKEGLVVAQGVGTIDAGYRGEVCVLLYNRSASTKRINAGEQIAQLVLKEVIDIEWEEAEKLSDSDRGTDGFGSTKEKEKNAEQV